MSRQSTAAQRNLSLTEELEKLEQSITLTLQEIDHNFSRAHRIVTTSIIPIVENYREHSNDVWEGSKFWKQFFEASANVSLSGYEEAPPDGSEAEGDESIEEGTTSASPSAASAQATPSSASYTSPPATHNGYDEEDLTPRNKSNQHYPGGDSPSISQSTPRPQPKSKRTPRGQPTSKAPYTSPFERLKRATLGASPSESDLAPSTPRAQVSPAKAAQSSPFAPPSTHQQASRRTPSANNKHSDNPNDALLHRVLDKTWRIQATPHSTARLPHRGVANDIDQQSPAKPSTARKAARQQAAQQQLRMQKAKAGTDDADDDFDSSPAAPAPELHAEIFDTPARKGLTGRIGAGAGRVPGVSVLTPGKGNAGIGNAGGGGRKPLTPAGGIGNAPDAEDQILWDSDDDDEDDFGMGVKGMSPPKTMQFHVPQSRLVQTPAREASKRIMKDLLLTAGMRDGLEEDGEDDSLSPSIVKTGGLVEEDTF